MISRMAGAIDSLLRSRATVPTVYDVVTLNKDAPHRS